MGRRQVTPAKKPRRVVVVGAGPAGLEAARAAAERGHRVDIFEAQARIGGQFRLAGEQPRRAQILELMDWYERQFQKLQVRLHLNSYVEADDIRALDPDAVVLATGSLPDEDGFQRWMPGADRLPGIEKGHVWSPEDVMRREAKLGDHVILYDEGGHWRGLGTAWAMAERGHKVTIVTPEPFIGKELARTSSDIPLRPRLAQLGVTFLTEHLIAEWHGDAATIRNMLTGSDSRLEAAALVMSTTNRAFDPLSTDLADIETHLIGDAAAPRQAPYAFHEGRKIGLSL